MALRTREQYLSSLKGMRPNIYKFGQLIKDVTTHPATRRVVESHARGLDAAHDPELADIFTTISTLTGETIHRNTSLMTTPQEMIYNSRFKRKMYHLTGSCTGALCVGWNCFNVMWSLTHEMDEALGTDYHERLKAWGLRFQKEGLLVAGAGSAETRARLARPIEWLTVGGGVPGCMHGGGSPDGARMVVFALAPLERYARFAKDLAGVEEDLEEPGRKK